MPEISSSSRSESSWSNRDTSVPNACVGESKPDPKAMGGVNGRPAKEATVGCMSTRSVKDLVCLPCEDGAQGTLMMRGTRVAAYVSE